MKNLKKTIRVFAAMFSLVVASTAMGITDVNAASPDSLPLEDTDARPDPSKDTGTPTNPDINPGKDAETPLFWCPFGCGVVNCGQGYYCVDVAFVSCECRPG